MSPSGGPDGDIFIYRADIGLKNVLLVQLEDGQKRFGRHLRVVAKSA